MTGLTMALATAEWSRIYEACCWTAVCCDCLFRVCRSSASDSEPVVPLSPGL